MKARIITAVICVAALLALTVTVQANYGGQDAASQQTHFDHRDHDVARDWYRDHRSDADFRGHDQWNEEMERRLPPGVTIGRDLRGNARSIPSDLAGRLGPLPRDFRYIMIGSNLCVVDKHWHLYDVIYLEREFNSFNRPPDDRDRQRQMDNQNRDEQFNDRDQRAMRDWYRDHRFNPEFRDRERWNDQMERQIQVGVVPDPEVRLRAHPVPQELVVRLHVPPHNYQYFLLGNHLVLVDEMWTIRQIFNFERH